MAENLYESATPEMLAEILREAESLLDDQLKVAVAADQRAVTFAGLLIAGVSAMIGAAATLGSHLHVVHVALASTLVVAALCALWSVRPTKWRFRGNAPSQWVNDINSHCGLDASMAEMVCHFDDAIIANGKALDDAAWAMRVALLFTGTGLLGAVGWAWSLVL